MRMVVLDGYTLNPGDNPWTELAELGELTVYDRTPNEKIIERCADCEVVFTNKTPLSAEILKQLPSLRFICVLATGYNIVDTAAAAACNIPVCNIPAYGTDSVAELTFALLFDLVRNAAKHSCSVHGMAWSNQPDYSYWLTPQIELHGKTFGVIGYGRIGRQVAKLASAFGMRVLAYTPHPRAVPGDEPVEFVSLSQLMSSADFISLHCPLTKDNACFINAENLSLMKKTAFLINTARGQLIDEQALADALNASKIAGAALDVLSSEPPKEDNPLLHAVNCVITPHIAWATLEARKRLMSIAVQNVKAWQRGSVMNKVN